MRTTWRTTIKMIFMGGRSITKMIFMDSSYKLIKSCKNHIVQAVLLGKSPMKMGAPLNKKQNPNSFI